MTTKNDILRLLQREPLTVVQLCEHLDVTRNAINVQLRQLEAQGLVRRATLRQRGMLGKPPVVYEAAPGSEDIESSAYRLFLRGLLKVMQTRMDERQISELLDETGRHLAREAGIATPEDFQSGLQSAMAAANALGANTEAHAQDEGIMVRNYTCPLGGAVHDEPCVCRAMASFFSEATGQPAADQCLRGERLVCQYLITRPVESGA
ncbi:helix-turn-helix transcriptional regulator [Pseudomonas sp. MYb118]|uniref:helix-turn-helix transcriptional regulator n=1 Tax=Pseudomonas sp. MYb118 TaxID=1848720 RepID=UPI0034CDAFB2